MVEDYINEINKMRDTLVKHLERLEKILKEI